MTTEPGEEWMEAFRRFAADHPIPEPPPIIKQRLRQMFERHHGLAPLPIHQVARLVFDSRDDVLSGVRGSGDPEDQYQRTYASDSHGVLLHIESLGSDTVRLEGQVLAEATRSAVWEAEVFSSAGSVVAVDGDENGSFSVADVPVDAHLLRLSNGEATIEINNPLGQEAP